MTLPIYQLDAFADKLFSGNPAAIVPLDKWISDDLMQKIGMENNLAETAFFVPSAKGEGHFDIRWFTPASEINLCGHATLASAHVLYHYLKFNAPSITFHSKSGPLYISRQGDLIFLDFPSWECAEPVTGSSSIPIAGAKNLEMKDQIILAADKERPTLRMKCY